MIIPFIAPKEPIKRCSFCKKTEEQVKSLFKSGANEHCICSDCVKVCKQRLEDKE